MTTVNYGYIFVLEPNRHHIRNASTGDIATLPQSTIEHLLYIRQAIKKQNEQNPRSTEKYLAAYQDVLCTYFQQWV